MSKEELRKSTITLLKEITSEERMTITERLTSNLLSSSLWEEAEVIGITISQEFEWDTEMIIKTAWKQNKKVCVPKCYPKEKKLSFHEINTYDQLEVVYYNLLEPNPSQTIHIKKDLIDLLIVPGLLFDKKGFRIGFGGGYYDRFLVDYPNKTVALCSNIQFTESLPTDSFDISVQHIITENGQLK